MAAEQPSEPTEQNLTITDVEQALSQTGLGNNARELVLKALHRQIAIKEIVGNIPVTFTTMADVVKRTRGVELTSEEMRAEAENLYTAAHMLVEHDQVLYSGPRDLDTTNLPDINPVMSLIFVKPEERATP